MVERILADFDVAYNLKSVCFATLTLLVLTNWVTRKDHNPKRTAGTDDGFG